MFFRTFIGSLAAVILGTGLAQADGHVANAGDIYVAEAKMRPTIPNRPVAIYLMIENVGSAADRLVAASSPMFEVMELHESSEQDGVMKMARVTAIEIDGGGLVALKPGGLHLMGFGAANAVKDGETFPLTLMFETAGELTIMVTTGKIDGGHGHGDHDDHDHGDHDHGDHDHGDHDHGDHDHGDHDHTGHNHGTTN